MTAQQIVHKVCDDWWDSSNRETFEKQAQNLLSMGWHPEQVEMLLSDLYDAVASEFGS